jgi:hypothetical protein
VSCDLKEINLDQEPLPAYEALSYSWDQDEELEPMKLNFMQKPKPDERPILCNGRPRHITMNLYHALTELRRQEFTTPLWADQISICQTDVNEKIAQIAIMEHIYRSASRVTIWLGKLTAFHRGALDFLERLPDDSDTYSLRPARSTLNFDAKKPSNILSQSIETISILSGSLGDLWRWVGIHSFLYRNWFRRAWTLQEFFLSKQFRILIGDREVLQSSILKGATRLLAFYTQDAFATLVGGSLKAADPVTIQTLHRLMNLFDERLQFQLGKSYSAAEYLDVIRNRLATVKKDKVVAGAALIERHASVHQIYPLTTLEVFKRYSSERLWPEVGLFALSLVGGAQSRVEGLPSWTPDLDCVLIPLPLSECGCPMIDPKVGPTEAVWQIDDRILHLTAANLDVIEGIGESSWSWDEYEHEPYNEGQPLFTSTSATEERFGIMFGLLDHFETTYPVNGEPVADAFWQSLIGGHNVSSTDSTHRWRLRFQLFIAFKMRDIRETIRSAKKSAESRMAISSQKKWLVTLFADYAALERRVEKFVDAYDKSNGPNEDRSPTLRESISLENKRWYGVERDEERTRWKEFAAEQSALVDDAYMAEIAEIAQYMKVFGTVFTGRRMFRSRNGYLGLGNEAIRPGDLILLVAGARVPYVFRPVAGQGDTYTLVGEAYVHGLSEEKVKESATEMRAIKVI